MRLSPLTTLIKPSLTIHLESPRMYRTCQFYIFHKALPNPPNLEIILLSLMPPSHFVLYLSRNIKSHLFISQAAQGRKLNPPRTTNGPVAITALSDSTQMCQDKRVSRRKRSQQAFPTKSLNEDQVSICSLSVASSIFIFPHCLTILIPHPSKPCLPHPLLFSLIIF